MNRAAIAVAAVVVMAAIGGVVLAARRTKDAVPCPAGFTRAGARCCPSRSNAISPGVCAFEEVSICPAPLVVTDHGCDAAERDVVAVPAMAVIVGPSDWEAEGRVTPRRVNVEAFQIDRLEVTVGRACASTIFAGAKFCDGRDPARAAHGVTLDQARRYCGLRRGHLPTDDQWLAAAAGDKPRRYPWGDTGAVCRRAAWGLESGPCSEGANGPDTVGAHPDGVTPLGIHDLAGNVAEWVDVPCSRKEGGTASPARPTRPTSPARPTGQACLGVVRGGSWKTTLATELRTWLSREVSGESEDPTIGFRCAYDGVR